MQPSTPSTPPMYKLHFQPANTLRIGTSIYKVYQFENGYGASVIPDCGLHPYEPHCDLWELAVTKLDPTTKEYRLTYDTPITKDVIRYINGEDALQAILARIAAL